MKNLKRCLAFILIAMCTSGCCIVHEWHSETCTEPQICAKCGKTQGEPLGHSWVEATCITPQKCDTCGLTEGEALGHTWESSGANQPQICSTCDLMQPLELPKTGQIIYNAGKKRVSQLTIKSSSNTNCYIKLATTTDKNVKDRDVFSFFVRSGDKITMNVPAGKYYVYFAYGDDWYGPDYCFGKGTRYAMDDELLDFTNYTWEYTLQPVSDGNFTETPIDADDF